MQRAKRPRRGRRTRAPRLERRVRVTFFLPAEYPNEKRAASSVIDYLEGQWRNPTLPIMGFTRSTILEEHPLFKGYWWSFKKDGTRIETIENVVLFLIDFLALAEEWKFDQELARLKAEILASYERNRCPQEEVWMVKEDIHRYA